MAAGAQGRPPPAPPLPQQQRRQRPLASLPAAALMFVLLVLPESRAPQQPASELSLGTWSAARKALGIGQHSLQLQELLVLLPCRVALLLLLLLLMLMLQQLLMSLPCRVALLLLPLLMLMQMQCAGQGVH
jgi:hypothetical protein